MKNDICLVRPTLELTDTFFAIRKSDNRIIGMQK